MLKIFADNPSLRKHALALALLGFTGVLLAVPLFIFAYNSWDFALVCGLANLIGMATLAINLAAYRAARRLHHEQALSYPVARLLAIEAVVANGLMIMLGTGAAMVGTLISPTFDPNQPNNSLMGLVQGCIETAALFYPLNLLALIAELAVAIKVQRTAPWASRSETERTAARPQPQIPPVAERPNEKIYRLSQAGWQQYQRRILTRLALASLFPVGIIVFIGVRSQGNNWPFVAIMLVLMLAMLGTIAWQSIRNQKAIWNSVVVRLGDGVISREQLRINEVRIQRSEVRRLSETKMGIFVYTANKHRSLVIPAEMEKSDYVEIASVLRQWQPFEPVPASQQVRNTILLMAILISFAIVFISQSPWIVTPMAAILTGVYIYAWRELRRAAGVDPAYRRSQFMVFVLLAFIVTIKLAAVWGALHLFAR